MRKKWLIICASILLTAWVAINLNINVTSEKKESSLKKVNIAVMPYIISFIGSNTIFTKFISSVIHCSSIPSQSYTSNVWHSVTQLVRAGNEFDMNSDVGNAYYEAQSALKAKYGEGIERETYALAYALQQVDAGVQLSWKKKGDSQFIVYTLKKVQNGNDFEFFVFKCL